MLNAFNDELTAELVKALQNAERDPATHVIVITGAGRAFSSGQDLADLPAMPARGFDHAAGSGVDGGGHAAGLGVESVFPGHESEPGFSTIRRRGKGRFDRGILPSAVHASPFAVSRGR